MRDVDLKTAGLRVPVRIIAPDETVTEGEALIDTGALWTFVEADLPPAGEANTYYCGCGGSNSTQRVQGRLEAAGGSIETLWRGAGIMKPLGIVAILGLDFLSQFAFVYDGISGTFNLTLKEKAA